MENQRKDGESYSVYSILIPLFDNQRKIENYLAIRFDMTNEVALANNLSQTLKTLEETNSIAKVGGWELILKTGELN
jgi:hypothetical protein